MTLHRFFLPPGSIRDERVTFPGDTARQIHSVLRLRDGEEVIVLDGTGMEYVVRLEDVRREVCGTIVHSRASGAEPCHPVTLYQGLLKGAKLELVLQKCTEIGVSRFVPVITARSVGGEPGLEKRRRYEAIVREAAEQCGRGRIPQIEAVTTWNEAVVDASQRGQIVLPWEGATGEGVPNNLEGGGDVGVLIGPEGGLTAEEVQAARSHGAHVITLGPRILRAETAALIASALVLARLGELG